MANTSEVVIGLSYSILFIALGLVNHVQSQSEYDVRLVDGDQYYNGRVEIYYNNEWVTVCDDNWDDSDAEVVCRQLGYGFSNAFSLQNAYYGQGSGSVYNVYCYGFPQELSDCSLYNSYGSCSHNDDAGVYCGYGTTTVFPTNSVRLVGGSSSNEGRVEIYYNGQWGTICDDSWDNDDAEVVCRQLGLSTDSAVALTSTYDYGQGTGPILLDNVHCYGYESSLQSCTSDGWYNHNCDHYEDAGVRCGALDVRLANGNSDREGGVEIYVNGVWGSIRYSGFDSYAAKVVCRQLGFSTNNAVTYSDYGSYTFATDYIDCNGYETSLDQCTFEVTNQYNYYINRAGVQCASGTSSRVIGTMSFVGISLFLLFVIGIVMSYLACKTKANPAHSSSLGTELATPTANNQYTPCPSAVTQAIPTSSHPAPATAPAAAPFTVTSPPPYTVPLQGGTAPGPLQGNASQPDPPLQGPHTLGFQETGHTQVPEDRDHDYLEVIPNAPPPGDENTYQDLDSTHQESSYQDLNLS